MASRRLRARRNPTTNKTLKKLQRSQNVAYGKHITSSARSQDMVEAIERKRREWHRAQRTRKNPSKADAVRVSQKVAATRDAQAYASRQMALSAEASRIADLEAHRLATVANRPVIVATPEPVVVKKRKTAKKNPRIRQERTGKSGGGFTSLDRAMKAAQEFANETGEIIEVLHDDGRLYSRVHPSRGYHMRWDRRGDVVGEYYRGSTPEKMTFKTRRAAVEVAKRRNETMRSYGYGDGYHDMSARPNPRKRKSARRNPAGSNWVIEAIGTRAGQVWYWTGEKFSQAKAAAKRYMSYEGARERMTMILPFLPSAIKAIRLAK